MNHSWQQWGQGMPQHNFHMMNQQGAWPQFNQWQAQLGSRMPGMGQAGQGLGPRLGAGLMGPGPAPRQQFIPASVGVEGSAISPAPPVEPPSDNPPLPPDPPPEDPMKPSSNEEQQKLTALQVQAQQWQRQKEWREYQEKMADYQRQVRMQQLAETSTDMQVILKEDTEFTAQYDQWKKQFDDWREQNKNHPNKDQYLQYEQQWKQYEVQMESKRADIEARKKTILKSEEEKQQSSKMSSTSNWEGSEEHSQTGQGNVQTNTNFGNNQNYNQAPSAFGGRGPRFETPRNNRPSGRDMSSQRFGGPRSLMDGPRPRFDGSQQGMRFQGPQGGRFVGSGSLEGAMFESGPENESGMYEGESAGNQEPREPRFGGNNFVPRAGQFSGPRGPRFEQNQGMRGPRPGIEPRMPRPGGDGGLRQGFNSANQNSNGDSKEPSPLLETKRSMPLLGMRGPRPGMEQRGPRPGVEPRGPRPGMEQRGPRPGVEPRGPRPGMEQRGPRPGMEQRGPRPGMEQRGPRPGMEQKGPRPCADLRGPRPSIQQRGPRPSMDPRGPGPSNDLRGPRPGIEPRGQRPLMAPRGQRPIMGARGPRPGMNARGLRPGMEPRGFRPGMEPRGLRPGMEPRGFRPGMEPRSLRPGMEPRGIRPGMEPRGLRPGMGPRGIRPGMEPRGLRPGMEPRGLRPSMDTKSSKPGNANLAPLGSRLRTPTTTGPMSLFDIKVDAPSSVKIEEAGTAEKGEAKIPAKDKPSDGSGKPVDTSSQSDQSKSVKTDQPDESVKKGAQSEAGDSAKVLSDKEHEIIRKAAEELKFIRQQKDNLSTLKKIQDVVNKPMEDELSETPYMPDYPTQDVHMEESGDQDYGSHEYQEEEYYDQGDYYAGEEEVEDEWYNYPAQFERPVIDPFERHSGMTRGRGGRPPRFPPQYDDDYLPPPRRMDEYDDDHLLPPRRRDPYYEDDPYRDRSSYRERGPPPPPDWDPYERDLRLRQDPYRDPYRDPYMRPPPRHLPPEADPYFRPPPPAEPAPKPEVIDYGHGQPAASTEKTMTVEEYFREDNDPVRRERSRSPLRRDSLERTRGRDRDSFDRDRFERDHLERDRPDRDRYERDRLDRDWLDRDRLGRDRSDRDRLSRDRSDRDRSDRERIDRDRHDRDRDRSRLERDRDRYDHDRGVGRGRSSGERYPSPRDDPSRGFSERRAAPGPPARDEPKAEVVDVNSLLCKPGRDKRPRHFVLILRGPPGAGKSYVAKLIKEKEIANKGSAPRILSLDDYFMVESEKTEKDPETGKRVTKKVMEYEYEADMEEAYRKSMFKSFKKNIDDALFNFIVLDAVHNKVNHFDQFWSYGKSKGWQVYIAELMAEASHCAKQNTHKHSVRHIEKIIKGWENAPAYMIRLDIRPLLQDAAITEVEMEDFTDDLLETEVEKKKKEEKEDEEEWAHLKKSKWELGSTEGKLDKLDGLMVRKKRGGHSPQRMEDYLQLTDDYETRTSLPGQKRVRWADIEERKTQIRQREIGFVVGQTNWERMTDDSYAERALNRTKYI